MKEGRLIENMLRDRVAIISGAGRGIGRSAALLFAQEGAKVVVNDIDQKAAENTLSDLENAGGAGTLCIGDVTELNFAERVVSAAVETWGDLHIIVNNAGFGWPAMLHRMTDAQWSAMIDTHLTAPFRIIRAAAPYLRGAAKKERAEGKPVMRKIINISSIAGTSGAQTLTNYSAAKSGILGLTKSLAKEWGSINVLVNAIAYGLISTRMIEDREVGEKVERHGETVVLGIPQNLSETILQLIPLGRPGTPMEAAGPILFLASSLSDYITGEVILVAGGLQSHPFTT